MKLGLRIDVDTLRGTRYGVPRLLRALDRAGGRASFFFSVGPDNMGRHLWRLARPAFMAKMLRSGAPRLYGWDILIRGTLWPGPGIARRCGDVMRAAADAGHEIGLHAWDHHAWQRGAERMSESEVRAVLARGMEALASVLGQSPTCTAAPGWKCTDAVLRAKTSFPLRYNSDCRGDRLFRPMVDDAVLDQVQVPSTLPTYDEVIGRTASESTYNEMILDRLVDGQLNVLTIHAEVEGICAAPLFGRFLEAAVARGIEVLPLGDLLGAAPAPPGRVVPGFVAGREGTVACLSPSPEDATP